MSRANFPIFIGYSGDEDRAYTVCHKSIVRRASMPVSIIPLRQDLLRSTGLYWRPRDPLASTEFTYLRFLILTICGYHGHALFVDSDFLFLADIVELLALADDRFAIQCVKHVYEPKEAEKMGGMKQSAYPRKNWSSLMIFNCGHEGHRRLTAYEVNTKPGSWLHRFSWLRDDDIGELPHEWNVLVGEQHCDQPKALHFTNGIRAIHGGESEYDDVWEQEASA
jgi:hypothetical protein